MVMNVLVQDFGDHNQDANEHEYEHPIVAYDGCASV